MTANRRQQAIGERRRRIVQAATRLLSERDDGSFSMQELARSSGVSLATPYNLFGSKAAILGEVFTRQIRGFQERHGTRRSASAVERVEDTVERLVGEFDRNPAFFRSLWRALGSLSPTEHRDLIVPVSGQFLQPLAAGLAADALISECGLSEPDEDSVARDL